MRKSVVFSVLLALYLLAGGPTALAHSGKQSYLYLSFFDTEIDGRVELPVGDLGPVLGIDFGTDAESITDVLEANREQIMSYVESHLALASIDGEAWDIEYEPVGVLDLGSKSYLLFPFEIDEDFESAPRELVVEFDAIIEADDQKDALLHIENDVRSGVFANESDPILGFSAGQTVQTVSLTTVSTLTQIGAVRGLGTDAVRTGAVHLLFVGVLMAPIALLVRGRGFRDPAPSIRSIVVRAAAALAAFAGGHLVTLLLTGLGVIELSSRVVVAATSFSLLAVAVWSVMAWRRPRATRFEPGVIAALGLIQGLGLGATFVDDGLDRSRSLISLLGFSLGVEVAVVIVAALVLLPMATIRRTPIALPVLVVVAAIGAAYSIAWILEGALDADWSLDRVANPWRVWPRNLVLALVVAAVAGGTRALFAARGQLRAVDGDRAAARHDVPERESVPSA